jgi:hypothetical protein
MEQPSAGLWFFAFFLPCAIWLTQTAPPLLEPPASPPSALAHAHSVPANPTIASTHTSTPAAMTPSSLAPTAATPSTLASSAPTRSAPAPVQPRTFHDSTWKLSFDYPGDWTFAKTAGEISTFHLDARSAPRTSSLRAVTAFSENPFPDSTFAGGYVYFSVTPHSSAPACTKQASSPVAKAKPEASQIAGIPFAHGSDQQKAICTVERDEIYTTFHDGACYRFDLAINNFCGGEVSGVKDITPRELDQVRARLESILSTVRFDPK